MEWEIGYMEMQHDEVHKAGLLDILNIQAVEVRSVADIGHILGCCTVD